MVPYTFPALLSFFSLFVLGLSVRSQNSLAPLYTGAVRYANTAP